MCVRRAPLTVFGLGESKWFWFLNIEGEGGGWGAFE